MNRSALLTASLALACCIGQAQPAGAQYPYGNPASRPIINPYINLLRGGASPAFNYNTLVRPELEFRQSINQLANQTAQNQQAITGLSQQPPAAGQLVTGAQTGFQNHGIYFGTTTGGPAGSVGLFSGGPSFGGGRGGAAGAAGAAGGGMAPPSRGAAFGRGGSRY
jgi:hypothetical protein